MKVATSRCARETAEVCPIATDEKSRWALRGEEGSYHGVRVSSGAMIAPFPAESMYFSSFSRKAFTSSFRSDFAFIQAMFVE